MSCGADGHFDQTPTCEQCHKPVIPNGSVSPSTATVEYGGIYVVTCDVTFGIRGSNAMSCEADGHFDQTPTCEGPCNKPVIPNGSVSPSTATVGYGAMYEVTCDAGFVVDGRRIMTCGAAGVFEQTPFCRK